VRCRLRGNAKSNAPCGNPLGTEMTLWQVLTVEAEETVLFPPILLTTTLIIHSLHSGQCTRLENISQLAAYILVDVGCHCC
jgi:hypothetical protein